MTDLFSTMESFSWQNWAAIALIPFLIFIGIEALLSPSPSYSKIIKDFVDRIAPENLSNYTPTSADINKIQQKLRENKLEYDDSIIRQSITLAIGVKRKEKEKKEKEKKKNINHNRVNININSIDLLTGIQFEKFLGEFFKKQGYRVTITKASGDQGVDLLLYKDQRKIAVQCKRFKPSNRVGNTAIQEVVTGKIFYDCTEAWVITTSTYTPHAILLANKVGVKLIDRNALIKLLKS